MTEFPPVDEALLKQLPPVLRAVVKALGFARAQEFLKEHGGTPVRVHLAGGMGLSTDEVDRLNLTLDSHLRNEGVVFLPKADKLMANVRNRQIMLERRNNTLSVLAKTYHLTTRHVQNICKPEEENLQPTLFDDKTERVG